MELTLENAKSSRDYAILLFNYTKKDFNNFVETASNFFHYYAQGRLAEARSVQNKCYRLVKEITLPSGVLEKGTVKLENSWAEIMPTLKGKSLSEFSEYFEEVSYFYVDKTVFKDNEAVDNFYRTFSGSLEKAEEKDGRYASLNFKIVRPEFVKKAIEDLLVKMIKK
jgi:hypothetical protein